MQIWPGQPYPLGATFDGVGTNFSHLFGSRASASNCACSTTAGKETRVDLPEVTALCWHGYLPQSRPGPALRLPRARPVGARARPVVQPEQAAARSLREGHRRHVGLERGGLSLSLRRPRELEERSRQRAVRARSRRHQPVLRLGQRPPSATRRGTRRSSTRRTSRGSRKRHPDIPEELRGTYAGHGAPGGDRVPAAARRHRRRAAAGAPVRAGLDARRDEGCATTGATTRSATSRRTTSTRRGQRGEQVQEFKHLVKTLHDAGIEVILDVVYNHTAEGNHLGPMLSFKGIDNAAYYRLMADNRRYYMDYTGTGNTLNMRHPHVLQLIMDSLRYWVLEMHVDGFRFDLAATLARELHDVDRLSAFFDLIQQDPVISQVKLIAEPWDVGEGGYQVGNFPPLWSEWNGKYRDTRARLLARHRPDARRVRLPVHRQLGSLRGHGAPAVREHQLHHRARRLHAARPRLLQREAQRGQRRGQPRRREPQPLVELRRRRADRRSGGPRAARTARCATSWRRCCCRRACRCCSAATRSAARSSGNNNAYCQDNEISWYDWEHADEDLLQFTRGLIRLRHRHPVFCRRRWFQGRPIHGTDVSDIGWFTPGGTEMSDEDWQAGFAKSLGVFLNGRGIPDAERARRAGRRRQLLRDVQREPRSRSSSSCPSRSGDGNGWNCSRPTSGQKRQTWTRRVLSIGRAARSRCPPGP